MTGSNAAVRLPNLLLSLIEEKGFAEINENSIVFSFRPIWSR